MADCSVKSGESAKLIFSCSGAADVGELSDKVARGLTKDGVGKMFCLAGVGGRVPGIMKMTESAGDILAIDGCELHCVAKCLKEAGFDSFKHAVITDMGMSKGSTSVDQENIDKVSFKCKEIMQ